MSVIAHKFTKNLVNNDYLVSQYVRLLCPARGVLVN